MTDSGLNVKISGYPTDHADDLSARQAVVRTQAIEAGTAVAEGTVVKIQIVYQDAIE